jgi:hypothetical protein
MNSREYMASTLSNELVCGEEKQWRRNDCWISNWAFPYILPLLQKKLVCFNDKHESKQSINRISFKKLVAEFSGMLLLGSWFPCTL